MDCQVYFEPAKLKLDPGCHIPQFSCVLRIESSSNCHAEDRKSDAFNNASRLTRCQEQHIFLSDVQHIPHLRPGEDKGFQFPRIDGDLPCDTLPDLGDAAAFVVGDLALVRFVGAVVLHGTGPEATVDFISRYDLLRLSGQDQQILEAGRLQFDRTAPVEKELLPFVNEYCRRIGDQIAEVLGVGQAGVKRGKQRCIPEDVWEGTGK